ncbi:GNAT family N-acetyltransferase [Streptomyces sp. HNM0574]|uniref:GNAT family N-acetyltransferase n=1 Tax=Streptomyces sp. HNM0574 TaxID=2714954 RepID=UPI00146F1E03|nr:GNAT family N-acetyltransferase [Streptomyces sp. HNM0574]NLU68983.1 GNAT family N-acetyltransferase [Streptomyces sp. HNM0574]
MTVTLRRFNALTDARQTLVDLYANVRAELLQLPNYRPAAFAERLDRHGAEPGWEAVIAYAGDGPVGYAYANTVEGDDRWWKRMAGPVPDAYTAVPAVAVKEIGVVVPWRGKGVARRIHDELLAGRDEQHATLLVNPVAGKGKVQRLYEGWGYRHIGTQQPSPESPRLACLTRALS